MAKPAFELLGFYAGNPIAGDGLTRGVGGPEDKQNPHRRRWCPQCKAVFEWTEQAGWTRRDCAICQHRPGVPVALGHISKLLAPLCRYKPLDGAPEHVRLVPWSEVQCELQFAEVTPEQFLAADLADLRRFWEYLAAQIKSKRQEVA